jgi:3-hydroxymyristoyl/3-hydroxydecanoyl-(acyl carrier protein) dehydratase
MGIGALPHAYPFRFVDTVAQPAGPDFSNGRVLARVSSNGRGAMGEAWQSPMLLAEAIAQAALLLEGGDPEAARHGFLAGIQELEVTRAPRAGETLEIEVGLAGRFGPVLRFDGSVSANGERLARGSVLVRKGPPDPAARWGPK